mmetsp:Transcript_41912/g.97835  ORF Transcript_41912/g.97835 Transcript_41912/m.97835 type:complete len:239 (-) Transcript_41912:368-1084(-)
MCVRVPWCHRRPRCPPQVRRLRRCPARLQGRRWAGKCPDPEGLGQCSRSPCLMLEWDPARVRCQDSRAPAWAWDPVAWHQGRCHTWGWGRAREGREGRDPVHVPLPVGLKAPAHVRELVLRILAGPTLVIPTWAFQDPGLGRCPEVWEEWAAEGWAWAPVRCLEQVCRPPVGRCRAVVGRPSRRRRRPRRLPESPQHLRHQQCQSQTACLWPGRCLPKPCRSFLQTSPSPMPTWLSRR